MGEAFSAEYVSRSFRSLEEFQPILRREHPTWRSSVVNNLRRIAVAGIRDPLTDELIPPQDLQVLNTNFRETIAHRGLISRQRAVLLILRELIYQGKLPDWDDIRLYLTESVTPLAELLKNKIPCLRCSEYLPDPDHHLRGKVTHRDIRRIGLPPATFNTVICNEVLEHVEELIPSLKGISEILGLNGYLIATVPFLIGQYDHKIKAIWREDLGEAEILGEPDYHGDPINTKGSLVYRYPGWKLLDDVRNSGFSDAKMQFISSATYGVLSEESPSIAVLVAKR